MRATGSGPTKARVATIAAAYWLAFAWTPCGKRQANLEEGPCLVVGVACGSTDLVPRDHLSSSLNLHTGPLFELHASPLFVV